MKLAQEVLKDVYNRCPNARERRVGLLAKMQQLDSQNISCSKCSGHCCTYQYNSMQIDPLQALELYCYLQETSQLTDQLWERVQKTVEDYRLNYEPYLGAKKTFRRYYTCPLFMSVEGKGCPVEFEHKPFGCLAYNPVEENTSLSDKCSSDLTSLELREKKFEKYEQMAISEIQNKLKIFWDKKPLPVALLEIHNGVSRSL